MNQQIEQQGSEVDKFFNALPTENQQVADVFNEQPVVAPEKDAVTPPENGEEPRKNRRHRRLEAQLATEREERIRAEERAKAYEGIRTTAEATNVDERLVRLYGPDNTEAAKLHMELLRDFGDAAYQRAVKEVEERNSARAQEEAKFEALIEDELESIEDTYNVDVTSDSPAARKARRELLELVQELSPKDDTGTITGYADFGKSWELYQQQEASKKQQPISRAKEIAARSMEQGVVGQPPPKAPTPGFRGWMRDFNING